MKVAFLILNHRNPAQLMRLLATLRSQLPDSPLVVHHDTFHGELPDALTGSVDNVHFLASGKRITWGDFSIADVTSWSLTWMRQNLDFDWVVLLSAQDYPIKSLAGLADDLSKNGVDAVFSGTPIGQLEEAGERRTARRRYFFQYGPARTQRPSRLPGRFQDLGRGGLAYPIDILNVVQPFFKIYRMPDRIPHRSGWRARETPFDPQWPCWKGSQWFALSRKALEYLLGYMDDHPDYVEHYRRTIIPDESIFMTIMFNSPDLRVENQNVTFTRWSDSKSGHPDTFVIGDLADLVAAPQYFARKFDSDKDSDILDRLDELISTPVPS